MSALEPGRSSPSRSSWSGTWPIEPLARAERQRRHLRAADFLESLDDEELVEGVGDHLLKAFQADPAHPQAAAIAERARPALVRAARRARALHAPDRALEHLNDALAMVVDDGERATILEDAAAAAQAAGSFEVAEQDLRSLAQLRTKLGDRAGAARASARLAGLFLMTQRNDAALGEVEVALVGLGDAGADDAAGVELAGQLARAHLTRGDMPKAAEWAERALGLGGSPQPAGRRDGCTDHAGSGTGADGRGERRASTT